MLFTQTYQLVFRYLLLQSIHKLFPTFGDVRLIWHSKPSTYITGRDTVSEQECLWEKMADFHGVYVALEALDEGFAWGLLPAYTCGWVHGTGSGLINHRLPANSDKLQPLSSG